MKLLPFLFFIVLFSDKFYSQTDQNLDNKIRLAIEYEQAGKFEKAESIYRELLSQQSWNMLYFESLNKILIKQKKYDESITLLEERIKLNPLDVSLYGMLGSTYYMKDNLTLALESWERGIQTNKNSYVVYRVLANYAIENRMYDKAIDFLLRGKSLTAEPTIFSYDLANLFAINMRFEEAAIEYCDLLTKKPDQLATVKSRITSYFNKPGASQITIETIKKFNSQGFYPVLLDFLAYCYMLNGNYSSAFDSIIQYDKMVNGAGNSIFIFAQETFRNKKFSVAANAFKYFFDNFIGSTLVPLARIGYVKSLEEELNFKIQSTSDNWKPFKIRQVYFPNEYIKLADEYLKLSKDFFNNSIYQEAIFRTAEIYFRRLLNHNKADTLYNRVIEFSSNSMYALQSLIAKAWIKIYNDDLDSAQFFLNKALEIQNPDINIASFIKFMLSQIKFWQGDFSESYKLLNDVSENLNTDITNDAIEYSSLINLMKKDSLNLARYANADKLLIQNKLKEAAIEFKTLADNPNLFVLNEFASYKLAEIFIADNDLNSALKILENQINNSKISIFNDKSTFLLALINQFGINNPLKASEHYKNLLEKFPNSLYFDKARENLNLISTK